MFNRFRNSIVRSLRSNIEHIANKQWYDSPFGKQPIASKSIYRNLAAEAGSVVYPEIDSLEHKLGFSIDKDWLEELALHTQVVVKSSELCYQHGRVLYSALSKYLHDYQPQNLGDRYTIWETGTARGFSALCMAKAMADQERPGAIFTFDVIPHRTRMYWNCIDDHDGPKSRAELLEPWRDLVQRYIIFLQGDTRLSMPKVQTERIHFAFLDGAHTYEDVRFEFAQIGDRQRSGDIIIYDDYSPDQFSGIVMAVDEICEENHYICTKLTAHDGRGYAIAQKI